MVKWLRWKWVGTTWLSENSRTQLFASDQSRSGLVGIHTAYIWGWKRTTLFDKHNWFYLPSGPWYPVEMSCWCVHFCKGRMICLALPHMITSSWQVILHLDSVLVNCWGLTELVMVRQNGSTNWLRCWTCLVCLIPSKRNASRFRGWAPWSLLSVLALESSGETPLLQLQVYTGDETPQRQPMHRMPFAVRKEVTTQVKNMQQSEVIQPSSNP